MKVVEQLGEPNQNTLYCPGKPELPRPQIPCSLPTPGSSPSLPTMIRNMLFVFLWKTEILAEARLPPSRNESLMVRPHWVKDAKWKSPLSQKPLVEQIA